MHGLLPGRFSVDRGYRHWGPVCCCALEQERGLVLCATALMGGVTGCQVTLATQKMSSLELFLFGSGVRSLPENEGTRSQESHRVC